MGPVQFDRMCHLGTSVRDDRNAVTRFEPEWSQ